MEVTIGNLKYILILYLPPSGTTLMYYAFTPNTEIAMLQWAGPQIGQIVVNNWNGNTTFKSRLSEESSQLSLTVKCETDPPIHKIQLECEGLVCGDAKSTRIRNSRTSKRGDSDGEICSSKSQKVSSHQNK